MGHSPSTGRRTRTRHRDTLLAALALLTVGAQAQGIAPHAPDMPVAAHDASEYALTNNRPQSSGIHTVGDYYFYDAAQGSFGPALGSLVGGFRASTGTVGLTPPLPLYDARPDALQSLPYIGLGYSHLWLNSQLSLNADFGLASQNHGHSLLSSPSSLDDVTNQLRWAPVMGVNVRYSF